MKVIQLQYSVNGDLKLKNKRARNTTGIRSARETDVFIAPEQISYQADCDESKREYATPHDCYVCRAKFTTVHPFYDSMCKSCGDLNYLKRFKPLTVLLSEKTGGQVLTQHFGQV